MLFQLVVEICVRKTALTPVLFNIGVKNNLPVLYSFELKARDAFGKEFQAEQSTRLGIGLKVLGSHQKLGRGHIQFIEVFAAERAGGHVFGRDWIRVD